MKNETVDELCLLCAQLTSLTERVRDETNEAVSTADHVQVIKHYDKVRIITAMIKESREALGKIEERLSREQVPEVMRASNIRSTTIEGVGRVSLGTRWSASIPEKEEGYKWLRENNHGGIIIPTVNAQTLGALAKELNENGIELPAPTFTTSVMTYTSITKVK